MLHLRNMYNTGHWNLLLLKCNMICFQPIYLQLLWQQNDFQFLFSHLFWQILQSKIQRLEYLNHLKDLRIEDLQKHISNRWFLFPWAVYIFCSLCLTDSCILDCQNFRIYYSITQMHSSKIFFLNSWVAVWWLPDFILWTFPFWIFHKLSFLIKRNILL